MGQHDSTGAHRYRGLSDLDAGLRRTLATSLVPRLSNALRDCLEQTAAMWKRGEAWSGDEDAQHWANLLLRAIDGFVAEFEAAVSEDLVGTEYPPVYSFSGVGLAEAHDDLRILGNYEVTRRELRYQFERVLRERDAFAYASLQRAALTENRFQYPNWAPWAPLHWFERLIEVAERNWGLGAPSLDLMRSFAHCMAETGLPLLSQTVGWLERSGISIPEDEATRDTALGARGGEPDHGADDGPTWNGLEFVAQAQRVVLARAIVPGICTHVGTCLTGLLAEWSHGEARLDGEDPRQWAMRLADRQEMILSQMHDVLRKDVEDARYPPAYSFSGVGYAVSGAQLRVLGDYESTRRSLRHELEAYLRANHRQAYAELRRAALHEHRFQYPNWAPWSPLHWYERLMEISESAFGRSAQTLELMRGFLRCIDANGESLVTQTLEAVDSCGLLEGAEENLEEIESPDGTAHDRGDTWADYAPEIEDDDGTSDTGSREGSVQPLPGRMAMPVDTGSVEQWTHWMAHMAARLRGSMRATALPDSVDAAADSRGVPPGIAGGFGTAPGGEGSYGAGALGGGAGGGGERSTFAEQTPSAGNSAARVIARDLLHGLLDHILQQLEFNPEVASILERAVPVLGDAVCEDFAFLAHRQHPLRRWMGELVNVGLRFDPDHRDLDHGITARYLSCLRDTVDALGAVSNELDEARNTRILGDWHTALEQARSAWETNANALLEPMLERERLARARRSLTGCALAADATLPASAAETIVAAWADILDLESAPSGTALGDQTRAIVQAICEKVEPARVNPLVQSFLRAAQDSGMPATRLRACIGGLAEAHRQALREPSGEARFDPRDQVSTRTPIRDRDDDPDLLLDRADTRVFEASHLRTGDWFEFIDKSTGRPRRFCLTWHGEASRSFLFVSLDGESARKHSLQGVAHELRENRLRRLPQDNPMDSILR